MKRAALLALAFSGCTRATADPGPAPSASAATTAAPPATSAVAPSAPPSASAPPAPPPPPDESRKGTLVVHIGDSFTEAFFEQNLSPRFASVGAKYWVKSKTPSYSTEWAYNSVLDQLLWSKPQLVLITLGANEVDMPDPKLHARAVHDLAQKASRFGTCVWITPPLWKKDTGFMQVIRESCAPCVFFDSDEHVSNVERKPDKIHPNEVGGARWAAAFWEWLEAHRDPSRGPWALRVDAPSPPAP